ncbi:MAG TPA: NAD(P)-dependent oxidoreductase [Polyangiaceae bacterium]|nr:NAD(P)-dependent oxidoreductase [Polyangiaceae bacterium]
MSPITKTLVTGASGFLGTSLCAKLRQVGAEIHGTSRSDTPEPLEAVRWWKPNLQDVSEIRHLLEQLRPDVVFHLASHVYGSRALEHVLPCLHANLLSTVNILTAAAELGGIRVVITGSLEEPDVGDAHIPSPYGIAKLCAREYARVFCHLYDVPVAYTRIGMVYGPGQRDLNKLVPYVALELLNGRAPKLSSGVRLADWVYVDDITEALLLAGSAPGAIGEPIELGSGTLTSVRDVALALAALVPNAPTPVFGEVAERPNERNRAADLVKTAAQLGWAPRTTLPEGLARTLRYYDEYQRRL